MSACAMLQRSRSASWDDNVVLMGHPKGAERGKRFAAGVLVLLAGCTTKEPTKETYFDRTIFPILQQSCVSTNTAANCHAMQAKGNAIGNLSVESYEDVVKRHDL